MKTTIINSKFQNHIDINDRGLNYGDGFFTTACVRNGVVEHWSLHLARLVDCAKRLHFSALDLAALEADVDTLLREHNTGTYALKIIFTRGQSGRGYAPASDTQPTCIVRLLPYPQNYSQLPELGVSLAVAKTRLAQQPLLAGLKTLNRIEQVLIKHEANQHDADDLLVLDTTDNVIETSSANLLMVKEGVWYTPKLDQAGIQGIYLTFLQRQADIQSIDVSLAQILSMDAVYCCNSLMGLVPIKRIAHHAFNLDVSKSILKSQGFTSC